MPFKIISFESEQIIPLDPQTTALVPLKNGNALTLPLKINVLCGNRTHNYSLGGYCYIHLTKRTCVDYNKRSIQQILSSFKLFLGLDARLPSKYYESSDVLNF